MNPSIKIKLSLVPLCVLIFISCNSSDHLTNKMGKHILSIEKQIIKDNTGAENFGSFFKFFKQDTSFQFERTSTPYITRVELVTINAAGDLKAVINTSFDKTEWKPGTWESDEPQKIEMSSDSTCLIYKDTILNKEIISRYSFIKSNGKWNFKTLEIN